MQKESRTSKSIKNSSLALIFNLLSLSVEFISRKVFIDHLGINVLGLNTTATNLLSFLNLAELGIGVAIAYTLYGPLYQKDQRTINEIVSLQGWLYRRIAYVVIGGAIILMSFFPLIFAKMDLPLWYAYGSFGVLLLSALLSYFVNYRQIVLTADQKEYKIIYSYKLSMLVRTLVQIVAVMYLANGYVWWLVIQVVFTIIASIALNKTISKEYPDLKTDISKGKELSKKYPDIIKKTKQLFFHRFAAFVLGQTAPLIIYAYASLALVAMYGNYMAIISGVTILLNAVFNSIGAGIGNLVAQGDKKRILEVFGELFNLRFLLVITACFGIYIFTPPFVTIWLGGEYVLDDITLILMIAIMYVSLSRAIVDLYINAYGLYSDVWAPVTEAILNIGLSVLLGYFYGLHGILLGIFISQLLIIFLWKPYFLFKRGLRENVWIYVRLNVKNFIVVAFITALFLYIHSIVQIDFSTSFFVLVPGAVIYITAYFIVCAIALSIVDKNMRNFFGNFKRIIINKICKKDS